MSDLRRALERRAGIWAQMQDIRSRVSAEGWTSELTDQWDRAEADMQQVEGEITRFETADKLDTRMSEVEAKTADDLARRAAGVGAPVPSQDRQDAYRSAWGSWLRTGAEGLTVEQRNTLATGLIDLRAMGVVTGPGGGYAAPPGFWSKVTETMLFFGGMLTVGVETVTTADGNPLSWVTNDDTSNTGAWVGENADVSTATDLAFGQKTLAAHLLTSRVAKVSYSYLQDADPIAGENFVARKLGERLGRTLNTGLTTGNGVGKPQGIITGLSTGKTTASGTAITFPELIDLEHSVDAAYRNGPSVGYMLHDLILAYIRKILDSQNRPIWQPNVQVGVPATINGHRYTINNDMDSTVATTKKTVAFGDFQSAYVRREVSGGQVMRLTERYAEYGQVGFLSFARHDGLVQDTSAVKLLVQA